jgi:hypothetical protein
MDECFCACAPARIPSTLGCMQSDGQRPLACALGGLAGMRLDMLDMSTTVCRDSHTIQSTIKLGRRKRSTLKKDTLIIAE